MDCIVSICSTLQSSSILGPVTKLTDLRVLKLTENSTTLKLDTLALHGGPNWELSAGLELYDHRASTLPPSAQGHPGWRENEKLAHDSAYAETVAELAALLMASNVAEVNKIQSVPW